MKNIAMILLGLGCLALLIIIFTITLTWNDIQKDSMLWNCLPMGNHECGPVPPASAGASSQTPWLDQGGRAGIDHLAGFLVGSSN